ncbi:hypothetical protein C1645_757777, partial [Glomus cerebriforme]
MIPYSRWYISCITCFALMIMISEGAVISLNHPQKILLTKRLPQTLNDESAESEMYESIYQIDPIGSAIIYALGIIVSFANMAGSSLMIYLTIRHKSESLTPSKRFPLYMATIDFCTSIVTIPNLFYPMEKDYLLIGSWCTLLGFITSLLILMNMMLMASLALITYLRICKCYVVNLGKKDWILFVSILFPTLIISFVTWYLNGFGPDTFWCFINQEESGSRVNLIALIIFTYVATIITSFCYMSVIKRIHNAEAMLTSTPFTKNSNNEQLKSKILSFKKKSSQISPDKISSSLSNFHKTSLEHFLTISSTSIDGLETRPPSFFYGTTNSPTAAQECTVKNIAKATKKMSLYIFLQLIQYTPIIIYSLCILLNQMQTWVYVLTILMLNLGGVAKSLTFMKNELSCNSTNGSVKRERGTLCKYNVSLNENFSKFTNNEISSYDVDGQNESSVNGNVPIISVTVQQGLFVD